MLKSLAGAVLALLLAAGLAVALLSAWATLSDPLYTWPGDPPEIRAAPPLRIAVEPLPDPRRPAFLEAQGSRQHATLVDGIFSRPRAVTARSFRGRLVPPPDPSRPVFVAIMGPGLLADPVAAASDGTFNLDAPGAGQAWLLLGRDATTMRFTWFHRCAIDLAGPSDLGDLAAVPNPFSLRILDASGNPVPGAAVLMRLVDDPAWHPAQMAGHALSDSRGEIHLDGVPPGRFLVTVLAPGDGSQRVHEAEVPKERALEIAVPAR